MAGLKRNDEEKAGGNGEGGKWSAGCDHVLLRKPEGPSKGAKTKQTPSEEKGRF